VNIYQWVSILLVFGGVVMEMLNKSSKNKESKSEAIDKVKIG